MRISTPTIVPYDLVHPQRRLNNATSNHTRRRKFEPDRKRPSSLRLVTWARHVHRLCLDSQYWYTINTKCCLRSFPTKRRPYSIAIPLKTTLERHLTRGVHLSRISRDIGCEINPDDDPERVQWAFNEARALLKENEQAFEALRQRLESGGATVGDCVAVIERRTS